MSLGFNGVEGGLTIDVSKVEQVQSAGDIQTSVPGASGSYAALINGGLGYITFGYSAGGAGGLTAVTGASLASGSDVVSMNAAIPITGW